jgi:hypothetical protein
VLLAPRVDLPADGDVWDEYFVLKRLIREGRSVVLLEPVLDVEAVVRAPIRRVRMHSNAMSFSSSAIEQTASAIFMHICARQNQKRKSRAPSAARVQMLQTQASAQT